MISKFASMGAATSCELRNRDTGSNPPQQHQHDDDQDGADKADAAVPEAVATKAAAEATEQEADKNVDTFNADAAAIVP